MKLYLPLTILLLLGSSAVNAADDDLIADAFAYREAPTESLKEAFNSKYLTVRKGSSLVDEPHPLYPDSTYYGANTLDDNILPLAFGIVPDDVRKDVVCNVISTIYKAKYRVQVSPRVEPYVLSTLAENGWNKYAYFISTPHSDLKTEGCISEENITPWKERYLAGISESDGVLKLQPDFSIEELDSLDWTATTSLGTVNSCFTKDLMHAEWYFSIPKGKKAEVYVPATSRKQVKRRCLARLLRTENGNTVWRVRGGNHHFSIDFDLPEYVVSEEFVFKDEDDFAQCHSPSMSFAENGDLMVAFMSGSHEHNPDTKVRICRKPAGENEWTRPVAVADPDKEGYCLDNPVIYRIPEPGEPLLLFYKIRPGFSLPNGLVTNAFWEGRLKKSYDDGQTWSDWAPLPDGFLGPIRNKPLYLDGRLLCGSSDEYKYRYLGTRIHFEWTDDKCATWQKFQPEADISLPCNLRAEGRVGENKDVPKDKDYPYNFNPIFSIQPTILVHKDGSLQALCRSYSGKISTTWSTDNGSHWSRETLTDMPSNYSAIDAVTLPDGRFALVYNDFETLPGTTGGPRSPLKLAISDDGLNWTDILTLEDDCIKEYSYPAIIADNDGYLHITYTWRRYRVKYVKVKI